MSINDPNDPWDDQKSNYWPLEEHQCGEVFAVSAPCKIDKPLSGAAFSRPPPAPLPTEETEDIASTATKTPTHSEIVGTGALPRAAA